MGVAFYSAAATSSAPNLAALQATQDLVWVCRLTVDSLLALAANGSVSYGSVDDGTSANAKCYLKGGDQAGTQKRLQFVIPGQVAIGPAFINNALWGVPGQFIVGLFWHISSTGDTGFAIYDATKTNTLLDGLPIGTSAFQGNTTRVAPYPNIALNGGVRINVSPSGASAATAYDGHYFLSARPTAGTEDQNPETTTPNLLTGWTFSDAVGAGTYANIVGGGAVQTPSGTVTLARNVIGSSWGPPGKPPRQPLHAARGMSRAVVRSTSW